MFSTNVTKRESEVNHQKIIVIKWIVFKILSVSVLHTVQKIDKISFSQSQRIKITWGHFGANHIFICNHIEKVNEILQCFFQQVEFHAYFRDVINFSRQDFCSVLIRVCECRA